MNKTLGEKIDALPTELRELANRATNHMTAMSNRPHLDEYADTIASLLDALIAERARGDTYKRVAAERDKARAEVSNAVNNYITASFERDALRAQLDKVRDALNEYRRLAMRLADVAEWSEAGDA